MKVPIKIDTKNVAQERYSFRCGEHKFSSVKLVQDVREAYHACSYQKCSCVYHVIIIK